MSFIAKTNDQHINPATYFPKKKNFALQENLYDQIVDSVKTYKNQSNPKQKQKKIVNYQINTYVENSFDDSYNVNNKININNNQEYYESFLKSIYQDTTKPNYLSVNVNINHQPLRHKKSIDSPSVRSKSKLSRNPTNIHNDSNSNAGGNAQEIDFFKEKCYSNINSSNFAFKGNNNMNNNINNFNCCTSIKKLRTTGSKTKKQFGLKPAVSINTDKSKELQHHSSNLFTEHSNINKSSGMILNKIKNASVFNNAENIGNLSPNLHVPTNCDKINSNITTSQKSSIDVFKKSQCDNITNNNNNNNDDFNSVKNNSVFDPAKKQKSLHIERGGNFFIVSKPTLVQMKKSLVKLDYINSGNSKKHNYSNLNYQDDMSPVFFRRKHKTDSKEIAKGKIFVENDTSKISNNGKKERKNKNKNIDSPISPQKLTIFNNIENETERADKSGLGDINNNVNINTSKALMCEEGTFSLKPKKKKLFCCIPCV